MKTLLVLLVLCSPIARAATTPDQAVDRGLEALMRLQMSDGGFDRSTAVTALAGMAMLAGGHTPSRGAYRLQSAKALSYVLKAQDRVTGFLGDALGRMYAHGFATLYLAECYGMAPEANLRRALEAAIERIYLSQNQQGGWRYEPIPNDADISVTICQIMALRAANNVGVGSQNRDVIAKAVAYVRHCHNGDGSFGYQGPGTGWGTGGAEGVPRCAAGCMSLIGSGINDTRCWDRACASCARTSSRTSRARATTTGTASTTPPRPSSTAPTPPTGTTTGPRPGPSSSTPRAPTDCGTATTASARPTTRRWR